MILNVIVALVIGFAAGLLSFKVKLRWCRECGAALKCVDCFAARRAVQSPDGAAQ